MHKFLGEKPIKASKSQDNFSWRILNRYRNAILLYASMRSARVRMKREKALLVRLFLSIRSLLLTIPESLASAFSGQRIREEVTFLSR